jgi:hypothetical protein
MLNKTFHSIETRKQSEQQYTPLAQVQRTHVETNAAAYYLNRRPQTLRCWAVYQDGAINPLRISGRLAWPVSELKRVTGVTQ